MSPPLTLWHRALPTSPRLQRLHGVLRERVPFYAEDRFLAPDIEAAKTLVLAGAATTGNEDIVAVLWKD